MSNPPVVPVWFHPRGMKMRLNTSGNGSRKVLITSPNESAHVEISRYSRDGAQWKVSWTVRVSADAFDKGARIVGTEMLAEMFDVPLHRGEGWVASPAQPFRTDDVWVRQNQGTNGQRGLYLRFVNWLVLPGPTGGNCHGIEPHAAFGTGSISVEIDQEIRDAIDALIRSN